MNKLFESAEVRAELPGWALRGMLCASVSFSWALLAGFNHPAEITGMILGVAFWVAVFALVSAWMRRTSQAAWGVFGRALRTAAWIKFGLALLGVPVLLGIRFGSLSGLVGPVGLVLSFDMWLGFVALWLVGQMTGFANGEQIVRLDSVGWTMLTTIVEGALMAVVISVIALVVLTGCRLCGCDGDRESSPVRNPG